MRIAHWVFLRVIQLAASFGAAAACVETLIEFPNGRSPPRAFHFVCGESVANVEAGARPEEGGV